MLLIAATASVEFSISNTMFEQINGMTMCSPLGPALVNISVRYYEKELLWRTNKAVPYLLHVNHTFAMMLITPLQSLTRNPTVTTLDNVMQG